MATTYITAGIPATGSRLRSTRENYYHQLVITRALYGTGKHIVDVTAQLNAQIRFGELSIPVTNATMGGDPYPNRVKTLRVWYTIGRNGRAGDVG